MTGVKIRGWRQDTPNWPFAAAFASIGLMPWLDDPIPARLLWPKTARWPKRRARALLNRFQAHFPELAYDMDLDVRLANAQAFLDQGARRVRLYGGLVRHRSIGREALAVVLAHESGHHLAGPPFHESMKWLSSEQRADEWALTIGLVKVFGAADAPRIAVRGAAQLKLIFDRQPLDCRIS